MNTMTLAKRDIFIGNSGPGHPLSSAPQTLADGKEAFSHGCSGLSIMESHPSECMDPKEH
jgi:hypothetical protein